MYVLTRHWNRIDINRIPEQDMNAFVGRHRAASTAWTSLKRKYGMWVLLNSIEPPHYGDIRMTP
jgi:hypothetical protein